MCSQAKERNVSMEEMRRISYHNKRILSNKAQLSIFYGKTFYKSYALCACSTSVHVNNPSRPRTQSIILMANMNAEFIRVTYNREPAKKDLKVADRMHIILCANCRCGVCSVYPMWIVEGIVQCGGRTKSYTENNRIACEKYESIIHLKYYNLISILIIVCHIRHTRTSYSKIKPFICEGQGSNHLPAIISTVCGLACVQVAGYSRFTCVLWFSLCKVSMVLNTTSFQTVDDLSTKLTTLYLQLCLWMLFVQPFF